MSGEPLSRRDWLGLGALGAGALVVGHRLGSSRIGRDVSGILDTGAILNAPGFPAEGARTGAVTMLVFSDYACGVCRVAERAWRAAAQDAGGVRIVHRDWPILGPGSQAAAHATLAAAWQGRYIAMHRVLMDTGRHDAAGLRAALARAGGSWARLEADRAAHADRIERLLARTAQDALQLGFGGTPGYLIGPIRINGAATRNQFADAIEQARAR